LRARVFAEEKLQPSRRLTITASGFVEGLLANREASGASASRLETTAIFRPQEASLQFGGDAADVLVGFSRVVWGRLDELQPTDVINPLDVSRFFFEGRSDARMPVALVRGRLFLGDRATIEAVYVPLFRKGRFDQLEEETSPFNLAADLVRGLGTCLAIGCPTLPPVFVDDEPPVTAASAQGGLRVSGTSGRIDWSISGYRGFEPIGLVQLAAAPPIPGGPLTLVRAFPRFTMIGGDFETVRGEWGLRGEIAAFVDDNFQLSDPAIVRGSSLDAGVGIDRKAGDYRLSATLLFHGESFESPGVSSENRRRDLSIIASADRSFARERYTLRTFGVVTPSESSAFLRTIATMSLRDNVAVEGSGGWFAGDGNDFTGRFAECDFIYLRLKYYF
jgi:hypothetical protein